MTELTVPFAGPVPRQPEPLPASRLQAAKAAYTTRNVDAVQRPGSVPLTLLTARAAHATRPRAGDLVLARVVELGQHNGVHLVSGRKASLYPGDEVVVTYGARYATDQFLAEVPDDLGPCHLAAGGGIAARVIAQHVRMDPPTSLEPVGLLADVRGRALNLRDFAPVRPRPDALPGRRPPVIVVVGTGMNAGKTTAAAAVIRGLTSAGRRVGATKVTGTGAAGDPMRFRDAGAVAVLDFTDAGHATTAGVGVPELAELFHALVRTAGAEADVVVVEIADGLLQRETAGLLAEPDVQAAIDGVVVAAGDPLGALATVSQVRAYGLPVLAVTGLLTCSPLALAETRAAVRLPVLDIPTICDPQTAAELLDDAQLTGLSASLGA